MPASAPGASAAEAVPRASGAPFEDLPRTQSSASDRESLEVTVYSSRFALVKEIRRLELPPGRQALALCDVAGQMLPNSVRFRHVGGAAELTLLEQSFRSAVLTPESLLESHVGDAVTLVRYDANSQRELRESAVLLSAHPSPTVRVGDQVLSGDLGRLVFANVPQTLLAKPTLYWAVETAGGPASVELSYLSEGLGWHADYVLTVHSPPDPLAAAAAPAKTHAEPDRHHASLTAWVTLDNQSGVAYPNASLALVAGDVQRVRAPEPVAPAAAGNMWSEEERAEDSALQEQPLFDYHLYRLDRPTELRDREQKQLQLLATNELLVEERLVTTSPLPERSVAAGAAQRWPLDVGVEWRLINREDQGLGVPLPGGDWRLFSDGSGVAELVGQASTEHTARDEPIRLRTGVPADLTAHRRQLEWQALGTCASESTWSVALHNGGESTKQVEVHEPIEGEVTLLESSSPASEQSATELLFELQVPPRAAVDLTYRLRERHCAQDVHP